jgi:hypothetical protein
MTSEELRQTAAAMLAFDAGKPVEVFLKGKQLGWHECSDPTWNSDVYLYRPKPEPKTRPMTRAEFPFGAAVRHKLNPGGMLFPTSVSDDGIAYTLSGTHYTHPWLYLAHYEYTVNGIDFHSCTVTE